MAVFVTKLPEIRQIRAYFYFSDLCQVLGMTFVWDLPCHCEPSGSNLILNRLRRLMRRRSLFPLFAPLYPHSLFQFEEGDQQIIS
jgi:hypothetical protein